jgi:hypothetical protein
MTRLAIGVRKAQLSLGILFFGVLAMKPAEAQTDSAAARALFSEGRDLMEKERFDEACPKLEESLRLDEGMGTQFNLAHCWEKVGRTASAWALFLDVAAAARASNQPQRETAARERAKALEPKLTRMRIEVADAAPDMKVERDDKEVGRAAWGMAMPIDPGDHVIRVTAPGKRPWLHEVKVPAASRTFSVNVPALEDEPVVADTAAGPNADEGKTQSVTEDVDPTRDEGSNGQIVTAWVVGGVGVAALLAGTIFAVQSRSDNSEALKLCLLDDGTSCASPAEKERHKALTADARREQTLSFIGFGLGGAAVIAATILYITAEDGTDEDQASRAGIDRALRTVDTIQVSPLVGSEAWGAVVSGQF